MPMDEALRPALNGKPPRRAPVHDTKMFPKMRSNAF